VTCEGEEEKQRLKSEIQTIFGNHIWELLKNPWQQFNQSPFFILKILQTLIFVTIFSYSFLEAYYEPLYQVKRTLSGWVEFLESKTLWWKLLNCLATVHLHQHNLTLMQ
jgi:hypothetical protein